MKANDQFLKETQDRETDVEIMRAISDIANHDYDECARIWENPTQAEILAVAIKVVADNGMQPGDFCWGCIGSKWADAAK